MVNGRVDLTHCEECRREIDNSLCGNCREKLGERFNLFEFIGTFTQNRKLISYRYH